MKSNRRRLILNITASFISYFFSFGVSFLLTPYLTKTLGKETYQFFPMANNFIVYMSIAVTALNSMSSRFITIEIAKNNRENVNTLYSSLFFANLILCVILLIPMIVVTICAPYFLQIPLQSILDVQLLFVLVFFSMLIDVFGSVYSVATIAMDRIDWRSYKTIVTASLRAFFLVIAFIMYSPKLVYVGVAAVIVSLTQFLIQYGFTKKLLPFVKISFKYFKKNTIRLLLRSGIWNSLTSIGSSLLVGTTLVMTNILAGDTAGGELSIAQTLSHVMNSIISMIIVVFLPRMLHSYASDSKKGLAKETLFSQRITSVICVIPLLLLIIFGKDFFALWIPNENADRLYILLIILLAPLYVQSNMWTFQNIFVTMDKVKSSAIATLIAGTINIVTIIVYSRFFEIDVIIITGITSVICIIFYLTYYPFYAAKLTGVRLWDLYRVILRSSVSTIFILFIGMAVHHFIDINSWIDFFGFGGIFGIVITSIYILFMLTREEYIIIKNKLKL